MELCKFLIEYLCGSKDELEIREEFTRIDLDKNGFITKGGQLKHI